MLDQFAPLYQLDLKRKHETSALIERPQLKCERARIIYSLAYDGNYTRGNFHISFEHVKAPSCVF